MFMCCVRNLKNINMSVRYPAGRIGDRGDREIVCVKIVYVPFLAPKVWLQCYTDCVEHLSFLFWQLSKNIPHPRLHSYYQRKLEKAVAVSTIFLGVPEKISGNA